MSSVACEENGFLLPLAHGAIQLVSNWPISLERGEQNETKE